MANFFTRFFSGIYNNKKLTEDSNILPYPSTEKWTSLLQSRKSNLDGAQNQVVVAALSATYTQSVKSREEYNVEYEKIKGHYLTFCLLDNIVSDSTSPDISSNAILRVNTNNDLFRDELERFQNSFNLDRLCSDFVYDLLAYGEYVLKLNVEPGQGVVEILDNQNPQNIVAFYKQGYPYKFMVKKGKKVEIVEPTTFAHFILSANKLNLNVFDSLSEKQLDSIPDEIKDLPSHVRIGRPILYGVIPKLKELDLMDKIVPATKLADIMAASIVSVEVPPTASPKEAFDTAREYENLFNKKVTLTDSNQLTATDILTQAGRVKVIPTFGGKGAMQSVDVRTSQSEMNILDSIRDTRDVICTSIGFPTELLYGGASRSEIIKKYARYLRKIKSIQNSIAEGIIQICITHFRNLDTVDEVSVSDFEVEFMNETVNVDELEKLEYHDAVISYMQNTVNFISSLGQMGYDDIINDQKFRKWMSEKVEWIDLESDEGAGDDFSSGAAQHNPQMQAPPDQGPDLDDRSGTPDPKISPQYSVGR